MRLRLPLTLGLLTACSGREAATPATDSAAATPVAATPVVYTITAKDYSYVAPDTIASGMVTLRLVNEGPEPHHVQLLKLDAGHTAAEFMEGMKQMKPTDPPPPWAHDVAGPNAPAPGGEQSVTQELAPGDYVLICMIPSADHMPHAMKGMVKAMTVIPATGAMAAAPAADIMVRMSDYAWTMSPELSAGKHVLRIENDAVQSHEMFIALMAPGKAPMDFVKWVETPNGPPPVKPLGGITAMAKGSVVYVPLDLEPGTYGVFCFIPDAKDGKMHIEHGMINQITVK